MPLLMGGLRRAGDRPDTRSASRGSVGREKSTAERIGRFVEGGRDVVMGGMAIAGGLALGSTGIGAAIGVVGVMTGVATATVGSVKMIGAFSDTPSEDIAVVGDLANPLGTAAAAATGVVGGTPEQMMLSAEGAAILAQGTSALNPKDPLSLGQGIFAIGKEILERSEADQAQKAAERDSAERGRSRGERSYLGVGDLRDHFDGGRAGDRSDRGRAGEGSLLGDRDLRSDFGMDRGSDSDSGGYDLGADTDFDF